jgi:sec-independent protein translocase protein TatC
MVLAEGFEQQRGSGNLQVIRRLVRSSHDIDSYFLMTEQITNDQTDSSTTAACSSMQGSSMQGSSMQAAASQDVGGSAQGKDPNEMTLFEHLGELRTRLIHAILAVIVGSIIAYCYSGVVFDILSRPYFSTFHGQQLIGTGPAEAFVIKLKVAFFAGVVISSPYLFYQFWLFIEPGLHDSERKLALPFLASATSLFLMGIAFCYWVALPLAFQFFNDQFESIKLTPTIRITEHLALIIQSLLSFGVIFELPVLAFFLGRVGLIDHKFLITYARHATVIIFVVAAVLTPPDVLSQLLMAAPLMLLYGISILVVKYAEKRRGVAEDVC